MVERQRRLAITSERTTGHLRGDERVTVAIASHPRRGADAWFQGPEVDPLARGGDAQAMCAEFERARQCARDDVHDVGHLVRHVGLAEPHLTEPKEALQRGAKRDSLLGAERLERTVGGEKDVELGVLLEGGAPPRLRRMRGEDRFDASACDPGSERHDSVIADGRADDLRPEPRLGFAPRFGGVTITRRCVI